MQLMPYYMIEVEWPGLLGSIPSQRSLIALSCLWQSGQPSSAQCTSRLKYDVHVKPHKFYTKWWNKFIYIRYSQLGIRKKWTVELQMKVLNFSLSFYRTRFCLTQTELSHKNYHAFLGTRRCFVSCSIGSGCRYIQRGIRCYVFFFIKK